MKCSKGKARAVCSELIDAETVTVEEHQTVVYNSLFLKTRLKTWRMSIHFPGTVTKISFKNLCKQKWMPLLDMKSTKKVMLLLKTKETAILLKIYKVNTVNFPWIFHAIETMSLNQNSFLSIKGISLVLKKKLFPSSVLTCPSLN